MNLLGLVFSLLLILSYAFAASWEKQGGSSRLRKTYLSHEKVHRGLQNRYESELYRSLRSKKRPRGGQIVAEEKQDENEEEQQEAQLHPASDPPINGGCAKINLHRLVQKGKEASPLLYEWAAKLLRAFYGQSLFQGKPRCEYLFLDEILSALQTGLQQDPFFPLEKCALKGNSQLVFYRMLKGKRGEFPSLLDYFKVEQMDEKICLFHAHPDWIAVMFNRQAAAKIHAEMHREEGPYFGREDLDRICGECHLIGLDPELFSLVEVARKNHRLGGKRTLVEEDPETHLSLRKDVYVGEG